jgi:hypothetical protein
MMRARSLAVPLALSGAVLLSACGGGGDGTTTAAPTSAAGDAEGGARGGPGFGGEDFQKIQECLTAAGITLPTPSGTFRPPTGTPPSGGPQGTPPSGAPRDGGPGGGPGAGRFADPEVQAALTACGITVPTGRPRPSGTASPST